MPTDRRPGTRGRIDREVPFRSADPSFDFNAHQHGAVQSYGTSQPAVDYILSQRYGQEHFGGQPTEREGYGMVAACGGELCPVCPPVARQSMAGVVAPVVPSMLELRYRGL